ncbi:matrixin family metalloprotease [Nanoarchaeota archaeon]
MLLKGGIIMKRKVANLFIFIIFASLLISVALVAAKPEFVSGTNPAGKPVYLPEHAVEVSEGVFSLGSAIDSQGRLVEGFLFEAKPGTQCGNGVCEAGENSKKCPQDCNNDGGEIPTSDTSSCYAFMAKGAKWKATEDYVIASNVDATLTQASLDAWDNEVAFDIFGSGSTGYVDGADDVSPDGINEVMFGDLGQTNTIAYTIVWGVFGGPPQRRELIEWDAVFNSAYPWSLSGEAGMMDYQNIATHEFGHSLGLDHPSDSCTEETMYAYADYGETKKQTLEAGDISGVNKLYKN